VAKRITTASNSKSARFISCLLFDELYPEQSQGEIPFSRMLMEQTVFRESYGDGWCRLIVITGAFSALLIQNAIFLHSGVCI
jgi:hypothetical protein